MNLKLWSIYKTSQITADGSEAQQLASALAGGVFPVVTGAEGFTVGRGLISSVLA